MSPRIQSGLATLFAVLTLLAPFHVCAATTPSDAAPAHDCCPAPPAKADSPATDCCFGATALPPMAPAASVAGDPGTPVDLADVLAPASARKARFSAPAVPAGVRHYVFQHQFRL